MDHKTINLIRIIFLVTIILIISSSCNKNDDEITPEVSQNIKKAFTKELQASELIDLKEATEILGGNVKENLNTDKDSYTSNDELNEFEQYQAENAKELATTDYENINPEINFPEMDLFLAASSRSYSSNEKGIDDTVKELDIFVVNNSDLHTVLKDNNKEISNVEEYFKLLKSSLNENSMTKINASAFIAYNGSLKILKDDFYIDVTIYGFEQSEAGNKLKSIYKLIIENYENLK